MKNVFEHFLRPLALGLLVGVSPLPAAAADPASLGAPQGDQSLEGKPAESIPFSEIGAKATADYQGDAIGIEVTPDGARLRSGFQKLAGTVTAEGLRVESTAEGAGRLQLTAAALLRGGSQPTVLPARGFVVGSEKFVTFTRPGVTEEYSVSVDGLRQDFLVTERPSGAGDLGVELALTGAVAETADYGAKLTLDGSGRELAYSRLRVTDAEGTELTALMEVLAPDRLVLRVEDAAAVYPLRIDPTFSDADWVSLNTRMPGANATVLAAVVDGSGNLYIGGSFSFVGTVAANFIAKWNGSAWSALGTGMDNVVRALVVIGTDLYAGGYFTAAGGVANTSRIAKWNGSAWSALGTGMDNVVFALKASGTDLYAGGSFTTAGGVAANRVAKWDGSAWSALGTGMNNDVYALAVSGTDLYAGGLFTTAGGAAANRIAKWDGSGWSALGTGMSSDVNALAVIGTDLYAGGAFTTAGGGAANRIAKWDGSGWSALGTGMDRHVYALAVVGTNLYAGGRFTFAGGVVVERIAKWDGSAWSALVTGMNGDVHALAVSGTDLYVGGFFSNAGGGGFSSAGGVTANSIAKWNGTAWSALGSGMSGAVSALAVSGTDLYAGGHFTMAGDVTANYIAKWNGTAWSALGTGMSSDVRALAVIGTDLYAGGNFYSAGGVVVNRIAKWDGSAWSALGTGMSGTVSALAVSGTDLYAGGFFTTAGGVVANGIAKWNGSEWSPLGAGVDNNDVDALAVSGTDLYAGGTFTTAGGVANTKYIAKWDGTAWSALGTGMNFWVRALAVSGTDLYAGGDFSTAGGVTVNRIAKWNGSTWSALGTGSTVFVYALAVVGTDLYAGGSFVTAGGVAANRIAKWDGSAWSALGAGMSSDVRALAADTYGHLFVGGNFTFAGSTVSPFIAQANLNGPAPEIALSGNGQEIDNGDSTPDAEDHTDFGSVALTGGTQARTFTINNAGTGDLTLTGTPRVQFGGVNSGDFIVTMQPSSTVAASGGATTFEVTFDPSAAGPRTAIVSLTNDDFNETPYTFAIQGTGVPSTNADLSDLTLSSGTLSPAFASSTTSYTASVASASITVTPIVAQTNAKIEVRVNDGSYVEVASGSPSDSLVLNVGINTVELLVTAEDTTSTNLYTITVTRRAAPTVTSPTSTSITTTGATLGGNVTSDGAAAISERGVVYSVTGTNNDPLIGGNGVTKVTATGTTGVFTTAVTGLTQGTAYSYKAYATNSEGTSYSDASVFFTDTIVAFSGGVASYTRDLPPGGRHRYRFTLGGARFVSLSSSGGASLRAELRTEAGDVLATFEGDADFDLDELLLTGIYVLEVYRVDDSGPAQPYTLTLDASVIAATRTDVSVGNTPAAPIGSAIYLPSRQLVTLTSRLARPVTGFASVSNRGNRPDTKAVRALNGNAYFRVVYYGPGTPGGNVTAGLVSGAYRTPELVRGDPAVSIRVSVTPNKKKLTRKKGKRTTLLKKTLKLTISASSTVEPAVIDAASIKVRRR